MKETLKNDLASNPFINNIKESEVSKLVKLGYVCLNQHSFESQLLDVCRNIQNSDDDTEIFLLTNVTDRKFAKFQLWCK